LYTQYADSLTCEGNPSDKVFDFTCTQGSPPTIYDLAVDLSCCDLNNPNCAQGVPVALSMGTTGELTFLNGVQCIAAPPTSTSTSSSATRTMTTNTETSRDGSSAEQKQQLHIIIISVVVVIMAVVFVLKQSKLLCFSSAKEVDRRSSSRMGDVHLTTV